MLYAELVHKGAAISRQFVVDGHPTWGVRCPFHSHHDAQYANRKTVVFLTATGPRFHCFAGKCSDFGWKEYRAHMEHLSGKRFQFRQQLDESALPDYELVPPAVQGRKSKPPRHPEFERLLRLRNGGRT